MRHGSTLALAGAVLLTHLIVNLTSPYGFHRDEFLYLAMGRHLRLMAMDFPPFIAIAARASEAVLGGSLVAVRFLPAVAGAVLVIITAALTRRFGGGPGAVFTAALAVALSPLFLRAGNLFQPVVFDQLWWSLALLALASIAGRREWILLGVVLGVGLLTKFSIAFIGVGIVVAVLATPLRLWLLTPWPWVALVIALAIGSPSIAGQLRLGFPVVAQMRDLQSTQLERVSPLVFLGGQLEMFGPVVLLALAGLVYLFRTPHRAVAWACVATFLLLMALRGKAYYVGPIYPALFAAGAAWLSLRAGDARARGRRALAALAEWGPAAVIVAFGLLTLPFGLPILGPEAMSRYAHAIGQTSATNTGEPIALPQDYADMLGWENQVAATARVYESLPPADRADAVILATNYGRAGAHDHLGVGLPAAISPAGSYWFFGPGVLPGRVTIVIGGTRDEISPFFESLTPAARVTGPWRVPEERDVTIWIARNPHQTLQQAWPTFRGRN